MKTPVMRFIPTLAILTAAAALVMPCPAAGNKVMPTMPDFTKGDKIPDGATHDWTLGATGAWMKEFGAWYFDLARTWDGSFPHQGPPEMKKDSFGNWDSTGGYLLAYAIPLKKILLTGKQPNTAKQTDAATAQAHILDGRGWSNNNRNSAYDSLNPDQLLARLGSW